MQLLKVINKSVSQNHHVKVIKFVKRKILFEILNKWPRHINESKINKDFSPTANN